MFADVEDAVGWEARGTPPDLRRRLGGVLCHGELLRYVQWHVLAIRAAEVLNVPVLRVHYKDYSKDLRGRRGASWAF